MQVISAKQRHPDSLGYNNLTQISFPAVTLATGQTNATVQARKPLGLNYKIIAVAVTVSGSVAGTCSINVVSGTAAENGVPITDQTPVGIVPSGTAVAGNQLFATDQPITMTADTVTLLYPANDLWDAIWPSGSELTLRTVTNGSAAGLLQVDLVVTPFDNHPTQPEIGPFVPSQSLI